MGHTDKFSEYEQLQVEKIVTAVVNEVRENLVCVAHCKENRLRVNQKIGVVGAMASIALGIKMWPYIIRTLIP